MSRALRPGVALVHLPGRAFGPLRALLAEAALWGRACPDFLYDPDAGPSWADRFDVDGNPQPGQAWPRRTLPAWRAGADGDDREEKVEVGFTFADAVALEPAYQRHLMALPPLAWDDTRQQPLSDWLEALDGSTDLHAIPYVWVVDDEGVLQRAAVTRALALISRDRLRAWHALQELAGFENAHVERAVAAAAEAARLEAEQARADLERAHAEALARAREQGAQASLHRLAETLVRGDAAAILATTGDRHEAAADDHRARHADPAVPPAGPPADTSPSVPSDAPDDARSAGDADGAPAEAEDEPLLEEPWVDSALCTTCNECTNLNGRLFAYNADKQATIADASAGTYEELVRAAEKCPARCIHPGSPRPGDDTATPELLARAQAFR
jgi:ferredoxin